MVSWLALEYWLVAIWAARFCRTSASWVSAWAASDVVDSDVPEAVDVEAPEVAEAVETLEAPRLTVPSDEVEPNRD